MATAALRRIATDSAVGAAGFALSASALLLQSYSMVALESLLIVAPVLFFPLLTLLRSRGDRAWLTYAAVNVWCVGFDLFVGWLAQARIPALLLPLAAALVSSAVVMLLARTAANGRSAAGRALPVAAVVAGCVFSIVPAVWDGLLTQPEAVAAPDIALTMGDGTSVGLRQLRGSVVVLNFWGVWCAPCVREMPALSAAARDMRSASVPVRFFAVNSSVGGESKEVIGRFVASHGITVPVAYDPDRAAYDGLGVTVLPTTLIIDGNGVIRWRRAGFASTADFETWLERTIRRVARTPATASRPTG